MRLDETIKQLDSYTEHGCSSAMTVKELKQFSKWLKELKELRKFKRHCELVHGAFFDELAKQGVLT